MYVLFTYLRSPSYTTINGLSPSIKSFTEIVVFPSNNFPENVLLLIIIVTIPVESVGSVIVTSLELPTIGELDTFIK